jgi:hypothetical protein
MDYQDIIRRLYKAFNQRDIDGVLPYFHLDVQWPNGWEGGYVFGHTGVRDYWTRQWREIDPHVEPLHIAELPDGRVAVDVHAVLRDMAGNLMLDAQMRHVYTFEDGLVRTMDIENN